MNKGSKPKWPWVNVYPGEASRKDWKYLTRAGYFCHFFFCQSTSAQRQKLHTDIDNTDSDTEESLDWTGQDRKWQIKIT